MSRSRSPVSPYLQSLQRWNRFAADQATMLFAAGEVIGRRTATMATHGLAPNAQERREMERMVEEKQSAALEGSLAAWHECMRLAQATWLDAMKVAMQNSVAMAPMLSLNPFAFLAQANRYARGATKRSMASASRQWRSPLDMQLRIASAAFAPARERVTANRKRLAA